MHLARLVLKQVAQRAVQHAGRARATSDAECRSDSSPSPAASTPISSTSASGTKA